MKKWEVISARALSQASSVCSLALGPTRETLERFGGPAASRQRPGEKFYPETIDVVNDDDMDRVAGGKPPATKRGGRIFAWSSVGLCAVVLVIGVWTSSDILRTTWHARGLDSTDVAEVSRAAETLAEIGSVHAIPHLLEAVKKSRRSRVDLLRGIEPSLG